MTEKYKREELTFAIAWVIFLFTMLIEQTTWIDIASSGEILTLIKLVRYASYLLFILAVIYSKYSERAYIGLAVVALVSVLSFIGSRNTTMLLYVPAFAAACGLCARKMIKISAALQGSVLIITILASLSGIIEDYIFSPDTRLRHGLGFNWTTTGSILYFFFVLQYIYLRQEKVAFKEYAMLEIGNVFLYMLTDSRMVFLALTIFLLFFALKKPDKHRWKYIARPGKLYCIFPAIICVFAVLLHGLYNPENALFNKLNQALSGRLELGKAAMVNYGVPLIGQKVLWIGYTIDNPDNTAAYNYVDCSYVQLLVEYGVIFLIMVVLIYTLLIYRAVKIHDYYLVCIVLGVCFICITEPRLMNLAFNPLVMLAFSKMSEKKGDVQLCSRNP